MKRTKHRSLPAGTSHKVSSDVAPGSSVTSGVGVAATSEDTGVTPSGWLFTWENEPGKRELRLTKGTGIRYVYKDSEDEMSILRAKLEKLQIQLSYEVKEKIYYMQMCDTLNRQISDLTKKGPKADEEKKETTAHIPFAPPPPFRQVVTGGGRARNVDFEVKILDEQILSLKNAAEDITKEKGELKARKNLLLGKKSKKKKKPRKITTHKGSNRDSKEPLKTRDQGMPLETNEAVSGVRMPEQRLTNRMLEQKLHREGEPEQRGDDDENREASPEKDAVRIPRIDVGLVSADARFLAETRKRGGTAFWRDERRCSEPAVESRKHKDLVQTEAVEEEDDMDSRERDRAALSQKTFGTHRKNISSESADIRFRAKSMRRDSVQTPTSHHRLSISAEAMGHSVTSRCSFLQAPAAYPASRSKTPREGSPPTERIVSFRPGAECTDSSVNQSAASLLKKYFPHSVSRSGPLIAEAKGFVIEQEQTGTPKDISWFQLERQPYYREHFHSRQHQNFIGIDTPLGTIVISVRKERVANEARRRLSGKSALDPLHALPWNVRDGTTFYKALLLTQDGDQLCHLPSDTVEHKGEVSTERLLRAISQLILSTGIVKESFHLGFPKALLDVETRDRPTSYKFGLLLAKDHQATEEALFGNAEGSPDWEEFLDFLGEKIQLEGWKQFSGGLDTKANTTGTHSRFTTWRGNEIMWHVSTMLPYDRTENSQQIERKRHIGNDIMLVVFLDGKEASFNPNSISSHFINNIIAVRCSTKEAQAQESLPPITRYQVSVASKDGVPIFGPALSHPAIFDKSADFKSFLFMKLINGELATQRSFHFSKRLRMGRCAMLDELAAKYFPL